MPNVPTSRKALLSEVLEPVFLIRLAIGFCVTVITATTAAYFIAFAVADFVTEKYATGFTSSVETLTAGLSDVSERLQAETHQLRSEKDALAADISSRILEVQEVQRKEDRELFSVLANETKELTKQMRQTEIAVSNLSVSVATLNESVGQIEETNANLAKVVARLEEMIR